MDLSQAILLRNSLRHNNVIMAYNGTVTDDLMVTLADLLKERLVANADPGGILISHETYVQVDDLVEVEERQAVNLKGIDRTIRTYAIKARKAESDKPLRLKHPQGVHIDLSPQYLNQDDRQWIALQLKQLATQLEQLNDKDASA